jgi:hypothetical protein
MITVTMIDSLAKRLTDETTQLSARLTADQSALIVPWHERGRDDFRDGGDFACDLVLRGAEERWTCQDQDAAGCSKGGHRGRGAGWWLPFKSDGFASGYETLAGW